MSARVVGSIPEHLKRENELQREIVAFFEALRCEVWVTSERRRKEGTPGMLDLYVIVRRKKRVGFFDVKQPDEDLRDSQMGFISANEAAGIPCGWGGMAQAKAFAHRLGLLA